MGVTNEGSGMCPSCQATGVAVDAAGECPYCRGKPVDEVLEARAKAARLAKLRAGQERVMGKVYPVRGHALRVAQAEPGPGGLVLDRTAPDETNLETVFTVGEHMVVQGTWLQVYDTSPARVMFTVRRKANRRERRKYGDGS